MTRILRASVSLALMLAFVVPLSVAAQGPTVEVVAEGLHAPRGLAIASDGSLLVAEAGQAGDLCPEGGGGFCLGTTGSVARVSDGTVERIVEGLPSAGGGTQLVGVSDIAIIDDGHFYLIVNAGGDPAGRQFLPPEAGHDGLAHARVQRRHRRARRRRGRLRDDRRSRCRVLGRGA